MNFDTDFVEEAVLVGIQFVADRGRRSVVEEFEQKQNAARASENQVAAFGEIYGDYFNTLGISAGFQAILEEFPLLKGDGISIRVSRAYGRHQEGTQLDSEGPHKRVVLHIQTCRLFNHGFFQTFLRHCLLKASDMVDPAFGYSPLVDFGGKTSVENKLLSERFNELWDLSIEDRLGYEAQRITPEKRASFVFFSTGEKNSTTSKTVVTQSALVSMACQAIR